MHTNSAHEGVQGHLAMARTIAIQNAPFPCPSAFYLEDLYVRMCSSGQIPSTEGGPNPTQISQTLSETFSKGILELQCYKMTNVFCLNAPHTTFSPALVSKLSFWWRRDSVKHTVPHIQTAQFSLPLLEACWGPEHALSRYELGENSSSGLVSMIWWEVLLSSNGIWQLTGGGLWELGSWADGRRLDEDVGGMGRPGKEDRGVKGQ